MAPILADVVRQFKADVAAALSPDWIEAACRRLDLSFRHRVLDPVTTVHLFLLQILHGNTAATALPHLAGKAFSAAAYCKARARLPLALFEDLLERVVDACFGTRQTTGLWRGHRTWLLDGSSFSMPDRPDLQAHFGQPGNQRPGCGFPVAHLLALFHAGTGFLQRVVAAPLRTHDLKHAALMHPELHENDVLVGDRAFASFAHLAVLSGRGVHGLFRCHQKQIVSFRPGRRCKAARATQGAKGGNVAGRPSSRWLKRLGRHDQLVAYVKPKARPAWMTAEDYAALPAELTVRELRCTLRRRGCRTRALTLVTTLLDPVAYPAADIVALYGQRWQVELNFRHLKTTMRMEVLHCQSVAGVLKELTVFALVYNLVRLVMLEASRRQEVALDRISFVDALRWLCSARPGTPLPALVLNPERERVEPRVVKRRPKEYSRLTKPRDVLRNALLGKKSAA